MKNLQTLTLNEYIIQRQTPYAKGELSRLLSHIGIAAKIVNSEINRAGLVDILGEAGTINVQHEVVQKLDMFANEKFYNFLIFFRMLWNCFRRKSGSCKI